MKKTIIMLALCLGAHFQVQAAEAPAVLTVDVTEAYNKYTKAQNSQDKFAASLESAQEEIRSMMEEGMKLVEDYKGLQAKANNPALTEAARKKFEDEAKALEDEITKKELSLTQFRQQTDMTLEQRRQSLMNLHFSEIKDAVSKVAKERNADFVFNSSGMGVMYANPDYDITSDVIILLNQEPAGN